MKKEKTTFADLSTPLKIAIIFAWIVGGLWVFLFILGFISGI